MKIPNTQIIIEIFNEISSQVLVSFNLESEALIIIWMIQTIRSFKFS